METLTMEHVSPGWNRLGLIVISCLLRIHRITSVTTQWNIFMISVDIYRYIPLQLNTNEVEKISLHLDKKYWN